MPLVDRTNVNAQSLNTREIVLRLDADRFECSLFYAHQPDPRLLNRPYVRLLRLPARLKTAGLLKEMFSGYDIIAYADYSPASYLYLHFPKSLRKNTKTVMHVEGLSQLGNEPFLLKLLYYGTVTRCDFYTGITERTAQDFKSAFNLPIESILPVGVNHEGFSLPRASTNDPPQVLFVGTLCERKRPLVLLEAAMRFPHVKFRMIGPDRYGYEQVVRRRMAEFDVHNVVMEGNKAQEDIALAMRESDVFLLPSLVEGLPKVTLEAAASGLPCVVFRNYETPSVVDGVTGFQVNTTAEMIEKLGILLENTQLRRTMGEAGRKLAKKFEWDSVAQLWQDTYLKIASAKG